ncbi:NUDIX domain-containing protein [Umezawaea sp. Da 62-37]|uniref:NUDIX domain-containing protein n=1 Tax=Umezawaea sp. Da 62-37 TaxID=3075927 RepID=UPI0028F73F8B|nr:NUDIX domain-containing protein [Umezawaea sp. Da 62-37]WNV82383.1 NUDIX domain-containing protein [Umezawaea sp. Da 62-37]
MPDLRATTLVEAPVRTVAGALLDTRLLAASVRGLGVRLSGGSGVLHVGAELQGFVGPVRGRLLVTRADATGVAASLVDGPLPSFELSTDLVETGGGTLVVDCVEWNSPGGPFGRLADIVVGRGLALKILEARAGAVSRRALQMAEAAVVVGAAITRDGLLLVQQRAFPVEAEGKWELPGGRVDPGETEAVALARECVEELGVEVGVGEQIGPDVPLRASLLLRVFSAELAPGSGEPEAREHRAVRWIPVSELDGLDWLPADRVLVPGLKELLSSV